MKIGIEGETEKQPRLVIEPHFSGKSGTVVRFAIAISGSWMGSAYYAPDVDNFEGVTRSETAGVDYYIGQTTIGKPKTVGPLAIIGSIHESGSCKCGGGPTENYSYTPPVLFFYLNHPILRTGAGLLAIDTPDFDGGQIEVPKSLNMVVTPLKTIDLAIGRALRNVNFTSMVPAETRRDPLSWSISQRGIDQANLRVTAVGTIDGGTDAKGAWYALLGALITMFFVLLAPLWHSLQRIRQPKPAAPSAIT